MNPAQSAQTPHAREQPRRWRQIVLAAYALLLALAGLILFTPLLNSVDLALLDAQQRLVLRYFPARPIPDVVVVGIDENTLKEFSEPVALWHAHLGRFLDGMALAKPAVLGLDLVLPDRSFDTLVPASDLKILRGLIALRQQTRVVLGLSADEAGQLRRIHTPFLTVAGEGGSGSLLLLPDADHVVRRFGEQQGDQGQLVPTLVGQMARFLGLLVNPGIIDYALGPHDNYISLQQVNRWVEAGDVASLKRAFADKAVLLGSVLPFEDRHIQPVNLAGWEQDNGRYVPGVLIHGQILRSLMNGGLVQPLAWRRVAALTLLCSLLWFVRLRLHSAAFLAAALALTLFAGGVWALHRGVYLAVAAPIGVGLLALGGRWLVNAVLEIGERRRLRAAFAGYVSPLVMQEIIEGRLSGETGGAMRHVCILFADVRGFTTLSESTPAPALITLLNRYFEQVNQAIHDQGGTISCFMGDGVMAIFGAPQTLLKPSVAAFAAARAVLAALDEFNLALDAEGKTPLAIGIGLHGGEAIVGHLGSRSRHDYSAIGDVVNVASRIEGLTKDLGYPLICSQAVVTELAQPALFNDLGPQPIKGHSPIHVWGWRGRVAPAPPTSLPSPPEPPPDPPPSVPPATP